MSNQRIIQSRPDRSGSEKPDRSLDVFFNPRGVALIGASRDPTKLGHGILRNLLYRGYTGPVYPVNPKADEILGRRCYASIAAVPDPCDLAVIIAPAAATPAIMEECGQRGIKGAVVVAGGFSETGEAGAELERQVAAIARRHGIRLIGPNCIGTMDTHSLLDTTFVAHMPPPGHITFVSHSGAVCGGVIDWALGAGIGFNRIVTLGNQADVSETDILENLIADDHTRVVALYIEGVDDGRRFVEVARRLSAKKPIVAVKVGHTEAGRQAAASHTGALAGSDNAYQAAFHQAGIIRVPHIEALFDAARALATQPLPRGDRVAILTNAGGPGVLAADAVAFNGLQLASLSDETKSRLREFLPPHASYNNPVDMLGGVDENDYARAMTILLQDPGLDALLVINVPQALVPVERIARQIHAVVQQQPPAAAKPVMTCFFGDVSLHEALAYMQKAQLPVFSFPDRAAAALAAMVRRRHWLDHKPEIPDDHPTLPPQFPALPARLARSAGEAARIAQETGWPVALKIASPDISHKSDVGGVEVNLTTVTAVRAAYKRIVTRAKVAVPGARIEGVTVQAMARPGWEVIVGAVRDPQFGPLVMFGSGGIYVELLKDVSFRLAPVARSEALAMIEETLAGKLLSGLRGQPPADKAAVADVIVAVSNWIVSDPAIQEIDVNPLVVYAAGQGAVAVDVRTAKLSRP